MLGSLLTDHIKNVKIQNRIKVKHDDKSKIIRVQDHRILAVEQDK